MKVGVYDAPRPGNPLPRRLVAVTSRGGAVRLIKRLHRAHERMGCWPACSTLWQYEIDAAPPRKGSL